MPELIVGFQNQYQLDAAPVYTGARATVYRARVVEGPATGSTVAIKRVNRTTYGHGLAPPAAEDSFRLEQQALADLAGVTGVPCLIEFMDGAGTDDATLVTEWVEGKSLELLWKQEPVVSWKVRTQPLLALSDILLALQGRGWTHGDLKPEHLVLRGGHWTLIDFGHAHRTSQSLLSQPFPWGTPPFLVPEACTNEFGPPNPGACEAYQFGCLLFQALTGHPPRRFTALEQQSPSKINAAKWKTPLDLNEVPASVPFELTDLLAALLIADSSMRRHVDASLSSDLAKAYEVGPRHWLAASIARREGSPGEHIQVSPFVPGQSPPAGSELRTVHESVSGSSGQKTLVIQIRPEASVGTNRVALVLSRAGRTIDRSEIEVGVVTSDLKSGLRRGTSQWWIVIALTVLSFGVFVFRWWQSR